MLEQPQVCPALPSFAVALSAALVGRKNLVCLADDASTVVETLQKQDLPFAVWENYETVSGTPLPADSQVLVLPNADRMLQLDQDRLAKYLQEARATRAPFFVAIATVSQEFVPYRHFTSYLKRQFWFACAAPDANDTTDVIPDRSLPALLQRRAAAAAVHVHTLIRRNILDVIIHIRVHRLAQQASGGGCSTVALRNVYELCQVLESGFGRSYVVPATVKLAAFLYFPFHIDLIDDPAEDISLLYGSDPHLVAEVLDKLQRFSIQRTHETQYPFYLQYLLLQDVLANVVPAI
ncbi:LAMI_0G04148g1_1 [Lachancea mirantina]|uniref:LAMI_0G04148g1_1 n=1 Tax=Lachancea mirantina TaxID=1230905 RepID=A0A1G4K8H2_9SACH|nr:LAMI_0G04148g1_1 [Lachancea mirantina]